MTNFQDPQPQSRRAARQGERSNTAEAEVNGFPPPASPAANDDMWDTTSRRAAQLPPVTPAAPVESFAPASPSSGRRSASPSQPQAAPQQPSSGEPLDYVTQQRPPLPPAPETRRPRAAESAPLDEDLAPTQALPKVDQPQYRVRDYSPEARRSSVPAPPVVAQSPAAAPPVPEQQPTTVQSFETQSLTLPPATAPSGADFATPERTMTRRELRALQQQQAPAVAEEPPALQEPEPVAAAPSQGAVTGILNSLGFIDTGALPVAVPDPNEASALALEEQAQQAQQAEIVPTEVESAWPFASMDATAPVAPAAAAQPAPAPAQSPVAEPLFPPAPAPEPVAESPLPPVAPEPIANTGLNDALAEFDRLAGASDDVEPQDAAPQVFPESLAPPTPSGVPAPEPYAEEPFPTPVPFIPEPVAAEQPAPALVVEDSPSSEITWTPPRGHWSTQLDEEDEFHETTINRSVGTGSTTTSALVLPSIPESNISGPLAGSGEIMLTGSIELPQTFSATGASARLEHSSIDKLFESHDAEVVSTESSPVSAVNAVSTRSGSGLGQAPKQQGTKALTALIIAAASMGALVVVLLGIAVAVNAF
ncbi:hypothetical protein HDC94_002182 [Leifsonia sp. AK011]|uniref:hypothetical protein n=1 Tax=Leifsonia sp. AK011 TaxID=2723075 RepID=UPI0015C8022B|nr:hypothetical protein [Leifsonia sp. AK011]NYF11026.1 hypothetical protein [Leifsonia sp. AK011]